MNEDEVRPEYDFSEGKPNPYKNQDEGPVARLEKVLGPRLDGWSQSPECGCILSVERFLFRCDEHKDSLPELAKALYVDRAYCEYVHDPEAAIIQEGMNNYKNALGSLAGIETTTNEELERDFMEAAKQYIECPEASAKEYWDRFLAAYRKLPGATR